MTSLRKQPQLTALKLQADQTMSNVNQDISLSPVSGIHLNETISDAALTGTNKQDLAFWDRIADKYSKSPIDDPAAYEHTLDRTRSYLQQDNHMLELGCGTGTTALTLSACVRHITATDIATNMLEIADRKKLEQGITNVDFMQKSVDDLPFGETYDVIFASSLLHFMEDLNASVKRIYESVEPGGLFISKTVCLKEMSFVLRLLIPIMQFIGKAPTVYYVDSNDLETAINNAGFEILESEDHNRKVGSRFIVAKRPH